MKKNKWKSIKINENQWKSTKIYEIVWKSMKINENPKKSMKFIRIDEKWTQWALRGHLGWSWDIQWATQTSQMRAKWSKGSSEKQEDIQSQFRVLQNDPRDSKSELQGTSNSITPNPLFIQEPQTPITVLRAAAEAKPVNSPHPFRGAGRDETVVEFFRVFKLDGPRLRRRPPPKNITKLNKKHTWKKTCLFHKKRSNNELQSGPQNR